MDKDEYQIVNVNWCKRRTYVESPTVSSIVIDDLKRQHNHQCNMTVTYENGDVVKLIGRVLFNDMTHSWCVNGINCHGDNVTIRLIKWSH